MKKQYKKYYKLKHYKIIHSYLFYIKTNKIDKIMENIYEYYSKELQYLCKNKDLIHNFIVDFFEKHLSSILNNFKQKKLEIEVFPRYLHKSIKNTFITYHKKNEIQWQKFTDYNQEIINTLEDTSEYYYYKHNEEFWIFILNCLHKFSISNRILFKLYYDFKLNSEELNFLINQFGFNKVKIFLKNYNISREKHLENKNKIELSSKKFFQYNILNQLNKNSPLSEMEEEYKKLRYAFYRRRISHKILPNVNEIAKLMGIKSLQIYNQLYQIRKKLYSFILNERKFLELYKCA